MCYSKLKLGEPIENGTPKEGIQYYQEDKKTQLLRSIKNGANWFYWIAGLSLVNTILLLSGSTTRFVVGLGVTRIIDELGSQMASQISGIIGFTAIGINIIIIAAFVAFGYFAGKGRRWAFLTGMILCSMDGAIFIIFRDFFALGFHVLAVYSIFKGYRANEELLTNQSGHKIDSDGPNVSV